MLVVHFLTAFAIMAMGSLSLYNFYFVRLRDSTLVFYQVNPYLYPLIFWIFPIIATIIFFLMRRGEGVSRAPFVSMVFYILMYTSIFLLIESTPHERLSQDIGEGEAFLMHMLTFFGGLLFSLLMGKSVIVRMINRLVSRKYV